MRFRMNPPQSLPVPECIHCIGLLARTGSVTSMAKSGGDLPRMHRRASAVRRPAGRARAAYASERPRESGRFRPMPPRRLPDVTTLAPPRAFADAVHDATSLRRFLHGLPGVDQVGAEARAAGLGTRSIKTTAKAWAHRPGHLDGRPDHARGRGHPRQGARPVRQGDAPRPADPTCPPVAAVCVYPDLVAHRQGGARRQRRRASPRVATAFPSGRASLRVKLADTRDAVEAGADEIDMVIDRGAFLSGRYLPGLRRDRRRRKAAPARRPEAHLKVILETGELQTYDNVRRASWLAMLAGARLHQDLHRQGRSRPRRCRSRW